MKKINTIEKYSKVRECYYITTCGKVLSFRNGKVKELKIKMSRPTKRNGGGYRTVCLLEEDRCVYPKVSRLVALAFINNVHKEKTQVDHIDKNKTNDSVNNLRWLSPKENSRHSNSKKLYMYSEKGLEKIFECGQDAVLEGFNFGHVGAVARSEENHHKRKVFSYKELEMSEVVQRLSKPSSIRREGSRVRSSERKSEGLPKSN
ncbi:MAG: HNH endonuclease [Paraclostridium sp.]